MNSMKVKGGEFGLMMEVLTKGVDTGTRKNVSNDMNKMWYQVMRTGMSGGMMFVLQGRVDTREEKHVECNVFSGVG